MESGGFKLRKKFLFFSAVNSGACHQFYPRSKLGVWQNTPRVGAAYSKAFLSYERTQTFRR
jgi:hypothetical protein